LLSVLPNSVRFCRLASFHSLPFNYSSSPGRCGNHAGVLAKTSFFMWFVHAIPRVHLMAISIKLAISIYFDCAPAILIAISIAILIYFDLFQSILIYFNLFQSISIYFNLFQSFRSISIHFDLFWFISILTLESPKHFDGPPAISIVPSCHRKNGAWWLLLPPHFASFTPIMQEYDISWLIWRFSDGKVEKQQ
jgi:hypothetical protein